MLSVVRRLLLWTAVVLVPLAASGCGGEGATCADVSTDCTPLYTPDYAEIFDRTLRPTCGQAGSSCHAAEGAKGGLVFEDPDVAYDQLLNGSGGRPARVVPGDAACSPLVERIASTDPKRLMPPGRPLSEEVRCSIVKWIEGGAAR